MNLYKNLSVVYHQMYQSLFDYDEEYDFYKKTLHKFNCKDIIEYGCGTGNLAKRFLNANFNYLGVDLNQEMLDIATQELPSINFSKGDLKTFIANKSFDCALITGRTISYLLTNKDVLLSFKQINNHISKNGIFIFDVIDAKILFDDFDEQKKELVVGNYKRISFSKPNLKTGWTWDWTSEYYEKIDDGYTSLGKDKATVRAFTVDEVSLFLKMSGFEIIEIVPKESYMWKDHYFVTIKL